MAMGFDIDSMHRKRLAWYRGLRLERKAKKSGEFYVTYGLPSPESAEWMGNEEPEEFYLLDGLPEYQMAVPVELVCQGAPTDWAKERDTYERSQWAPSASSDIPQKPPKWQWKTSQQKRRKRERRERIQELLAHGMSNAEIARAVRVTPTTIAYWRDKR